MLINKVAVVTGGSRGIGREIALEFAREGADVVVNYYSYDKGAYEVANLIKNMGRKSLVVKADVSNYEDVSKMVEDIYREFEKVDILVNNAGVLINKPLLETSREEWDRVISVNLNGVFYTLKLFARRMAEDGGGSIINISSVAGYIPLINTGAYSASKAGVIILTKQAAVELGPKDIRVNAICPGPVLTDMLLSEYTGEELEIRKEMMPLKRLGEPSDIAKLAVFLASDDAKYITGSVYEIDGGFGVSAYYLLRRLFEAEKKLRR